MEIKVNPEMEKVVAKLQGTAVTSNLAEEMVSAWMKIKKHIEDNDSDSCMGAPLFLRYVILWYLKMSEEGKITDSWDWNNQDVCDDMDKFSYWKTSLMPVQKNEPASFFESNQKDIVNRSMGSGMDNFICWCMGYTINFFGGIPSAPVEFLGVYIWSIISSNKFQNFMLNTKVSWRNPSTWKVIPSTCNDYRLDISYDSDLDLCAFFETFSRWEDYKDGHEYLDCKMADEIRNVFRKNKMFFKEMMKDTDSINISDNFYLDLWFKYEFNDMVRRSRDED